MLCTTNTMSPMSPMKTMSMMKTMANMGLSRWPWQKLKRLFLGPGKVKSKDMCATRRLVARYCLIWCDDDDEDSCEDENDEDPCENDEDPCDEAIEDLEHAIMSTRISLA